jgi:hypothetical protein
MGLAGQLNTQLNHSRRRELLSAQADAKAALGDAAKINIFGTRPDAPDINRLSVPEFWYECLLSLGRRPKADRLKS